MEHTCKKNILIYIHTQHILYTINYILYVIYFIHIYIILNAIIAKVQSKKALSETSKILNDLNLLLKLLPFQNVKAINDLQFNRLLERSSGNVEGGTGMKEVRS